MESASREPDPMANPQPRPTAVLLIAHGSRNPRANQDLFELAERLAAAGRHAIVEACFLELAEPDIASGGRRCVDRGAELVLMVPYFLSMGVHLVRDLAEAREELESRHSGVRFRLGSPLGPDPLLDQLVGRRIDEIEGEASPLVPIWPGVVPDRAMVELDARADEG